MFKKEKHTLLLSSFWDVLLLNLMPMDCVEPGPLFYLYVKEVARGSSSAETRMFGMGAVGLDFQAERSSAPNACDPKLDINMIDNQL